MVGEHLVEAVDVETENVVDIVEMVEVFCDKVFESVEGFMIGVSADAGVDFEDVRADEPDEVREVGSSGFINDEFKHGGVVHFVDVEGKSSNCDPDHALAVVEEFDGFCVEREVVGVLVIEEVDGVLVEAKGESFEERDVVSHNLLVGEIEPVDDDGVDVVVGEEVVDGRFVPDVFEENVECLEDLDADVASTFLVYYFEKVRMHISFQEEIEHGAVILVSPN